MADKSKTREVIVNCLQCGKPIVLFPPLKPGIELNIVDPPNTIQEKTCPHCQVKAKYPATLWKEVEVT